MLTKREMGPYKTFSDLELSNLLREGDKRAYTEIYNRYWKIIYTIAYNRVKDSQAAEDLVHDTFASIWIGRDRAAVENLKHYLAVAIKYRTLEYLRRARLWNNYEVSVPAGDDQNLYDMEEALHYKNILEILQEEIENLPEKCRLIFRYSRDQNKSAKEIAMELNISQSTVENQLNKALNRLRIALKNISVFIFSMLL